MGRPTEWRSYPAPTPAGSQTAVESDRDTSVVPSDSQSVDDDDPWRDFENIPPAPGFSHLFLDLARSHHGVGSSVPVGDTDLLLGPHSFRVSKKSTSHWKFLTTIPTQQICEWFDTQVSSECAGLLVCATSDRCRVGQLNDYGKKEDEVSEAVEFQWVGHPGYSPKDWRARQFLVDWAPDPEHLVDRKTAIVKKLPVARCFFICHGRHWTADKVKGSSVDETGLPIPKKRNHKQKKIQPAPDGSEVPTPPKLALVKPPRWHECTGTPHNNVKLMVRANCFSRVSALILGLDRDLRPQAHAGNDLSIW